MDQLDQQIRKAHRRLLAQAWLAALPWWLTAGLALAAIAIGVDKVYPFGLESWAWLAGAVVVSMLTAAVWTFARRASPLEAAIEIDRRCGLKERVSTAYALTPVELESAAGRALVSDAARRVRDVNVSDQFGLSLDRWSLLPLAPMALALAVAFLVSPVASQQQAAASTSIKSEKQVQTSAKQLEKKLAQQREQAKKEGLKDAEELFTKLEQATKNDLTNRGQLDKKQALVKLNDLSKELEQRREKLAASESLKNKLNDLKNLDKGPADKLAQALKDGQLQDAMRELERLKQEIADGKLDEESKKQLGKQLEQMQQKLEQMARAQKEAQESLKQQIAEKRAAGKKDEADELQRQLDKLNNQTAQQQQLDKLAQKLGQCAQCMKQGDGQGAMKQLEDMQSALGDLEQQLAESDLLDEALDQIADARDAMNCKQCNGRGCKACQGQGNNPDGDPGQGLGRGRGQGPRPEEKGPTNSYDSTVKQKVGKGSAVMVGETVGPNLRGNVEQEIATEFEQVRTQAADPLTGQRLPKTSQNQAKEYFDALREGRP